MEIAFTLIIGIALVVYGIKIFIKNRIEFEYRDGAGGHKKAGHIDLTPKKWKKASFTGKWVRPFSVLLSLAGLIIIFKSITEIITTYI